MASSIEIVSLADIGLSNVSSVGCEITDAVQQPEIQALLDLRHLWSVIDQHRDHAETIGSMIRSYNAVKAGTLGAFAILDSQSNRAIGRAEYRPYTRLWQQHLPLPAQLTRNGIFGHRISAGQVHVTAWMCTDDNAEERMTEMYQFLRQQGQGLLEESWTIEPERSPQYIHEAIVHAGYRFVRSGRFDDMEAGKHVPPPSRLYRSSNP